MSHPQRTIYLAGPIRSNPDFIRDFEIAAETLRLTGDVVINPVETAGSHMDKPPEWYMRIDFGYIREVDEVLLLPGWRKSAGCKAEVIFAQSIGVPVIEWTSRGTFLPVTIDLLKTELVEVG